MEINQGYIDILHNCNSKILRDTVDRVKAIGDFEAFEVVIANEVYEEVSRYHNNNLKIWKLPIELKMDNISGLRGRVEIYMKNGIISVMYTLENITLVMRLNVFGFNDGFTRSTRLCRIFSSRTLSEYIDKGLECDYITYALRDYERNVDFKSTLLEAELKVFHNFNLAMRTVSTLDLSWYRIRNRDLHIRLMQYILASLEDSWLFMGNDTRERSYLNDSEVVITNVETGRTHLYKYEKDLIIKLAQVLNDKLQILC